MYAYYGQSWNGSSCTAFPVNAHIFDRRCYEKHTNSGTTILSQAKTTYDNQGNTTAVSAWVSGTKWLTTNLAYNSNGTLASVTEPNSGVTTYSNFACNGMLPQTITLPKASAGSVTLGYNCDGGVVTSVQNLNGYSSSYQYNDPLWRATGYTNPDGGSGTITYSTGSTPWSVTRTTAVSPTATETETTGFDGFGRPYQYHPLIRIRPMVSVLLFSNITT